MFGGGVVGEEVVSGEGNERNRVMNQGEKAVLRFPTRLWTCFAVRGSVLES